MLSQLALRLREKRFGPGEIVHPPMSLEERIFFVMGGNVDSYLLIKNRVHVIKSYKPGDVINDREFFAGQIAQAGAITTNVVSLVYLHKEDFLEVLKDNPKDFEKYHMLKDLINLYNVHYFILLPIIKSLKNNG
jgi:CRP-like cAMP-binding protein